MDEYAVGRLLGNISYQDWVTKELFSFGWFVVLGVQLAVYAVWLQLLDKSRVRDILLFGSLSSIGFILADVILGSYYGLYSAKISLLPIKPALFIVSITVTPVLFMMVYQYFSSWKRYTLGLAICSAALSFGLAPLYKYLGILEYHLGWNYFYSFLRTFTDGMIARAMVLWFASIEQNHLTESVNRGFARLQPVATKPISHEETDKSNE